MKGPLSLLVPSLLALVLCSACSGKQTALLRQSGGKVFAVTSPQANFYRYGPQQGNGPDEQLPKDTLLTLIRPSFGYCKVKLVGTEKEGYVASEDIQPAPPTLLAALNPAPPTSQSEHFDVGSSEPPPPEALPDPDLPPTSEPPPQ